MADEKNSGWYVEFARGWWRRCLGPNRDQKERGEITSTYHGSVTEAEMLELDRIVHDFLGRRPHPDGDAQVELLRGGKELKISVGGSVHQRSIREWHALSVASFARSSGPILQDFQKGLESPTAAVMPSAVAHSDCPDCGGTGSTPISTCLRCGGTGSLQSATAPSIGQPCPTCGEKFFGDLTGIEWHDVHVQYQRLVNRVLDEVEAMRRGVAVTYAAGQDPVRDLRRQSPSDEQLSASERAVNKARATDRTTPAPGRSIFDIEREGGPDA